MIRLSKRIERVEPSPTLAISARAKAMKARGIDIISFGAGEPDFETPEEVVEAGKAAMDAGKTRYTPASGIPELRAAVADDYERRGRNVDPDQVIMTVGGKQALYNATQVLFDPGDEVVIPAPYWVSYPAQLHLAGAIPKAITTDVSEDYKLRPQALRQALSGSSVRGLILCSPSNPTGSTYSEEELQELAAVLRDFPDVLVLYDAMYDRIYYDGEVAPDLVAVAPSLAGRVLTFNGFSKTYSMTGWRLGYAIGPSEVIAAMGILQSQSTSNATSFVQYAALEALALDDSVIAERRDAFRGRRDLIVAALCAIDGVSCPTPSGAFYVFPDFSSFVGEDGQFEDDLELTKYLLDEAEVAVVPGSAFGSPGGLRLSYAMDSKTITEGVERIKISLNALTDQ